MGQHDYRLKPLSDDELLLGLSKIVQRRNHVTAEFLAYLAELDERQLFLPRGFSSLFEYCVEELGLCESTAGRHIAAARVCRHHPQALAMVASGTLHASALSLMRKFVTSENAQELFELCRRKSARKVEELLALRFPRPDVRDLVRRLPARARRAPHVDCALQSAELPREPASRALDVECALPKPELVPDATLRELGSRTAETAESATPRLETPVRCLTTSPGDATSDPRKSRRLDPLSPDRYGVHFTADGEFCELLERVRGLAGHRLPSGDLMTLMKRGLEAYERELERERFALGRKPRRSQSVTAASKPDAPEVSTIDGSPTISGAEGSSAEALPSVSARTVSTALSTSDTRQSRSMADARGRAPATDAVALFPAAHKVEPGPVPNGKRRLRCPAEVLRQVFVRDGKRCTYVAADGRRCGARKWLELDHIEPWAIGGENTIRNLRLLCRAHNQWHAQQCFGRAQVEAAIWRARAARVNR